LTIIIYGIKNCDTVRRARAWLDSRGVDYRFHDYRVDGLDPRLLGLWSERLGWEALLNRSSATFRNLPEADRHRLDAEKAMALMLSQPAIIKRPVLDAGGRLMVGFAPERYERALANS
jgi:arsenate reductase